MPIAYISSTELGQYGLVGVPPVYLQRASSLVDSLLFRPEGLTWSPDGNGWPCYQSRMTPRLTLTVAGPIVPGTNVIVPLSGVADSNPDQLNGEVVILDRATPSITEACVIAPISGSSSNSATNVISSIMFQSVTFSHPGPVTLDFGMVISELKNLPEGRPLVHLSAWPIARIVSAIGRYGYGRHSGDTYGYREDFAMLQILRTFGGAPLWQIYPITSASWDAQTGHVWIPSGTWLSYFNETLIRYVSGWSQANIPEAIKQSVAALAKGMQNQMLPTNIISYKAGDTQITRAAATVLDQDMQRQLKAYSAHQFS